MKTFKIGNDALHSTSTEPMNSLDILVNAAVYIGKSPLDPLNTYGIDATCDVCPGILIEGFYWNSFTKNGDALQLMANAGISVEMDDLVTVDTTYLGGVPFGEYADCATAWVVGDAPDRKVIQVSETYADHNGDKECALRHAVTKLASKLQIIRNSFMAQLSNTV